MLIPEIPAQMPTMGNRFSRALGRGLLRLIGWRVAGELPAQKKLMVIGAPHTSNWDFLVASFALLALGLKASVMMKQEAFVWPLKGLFSAMGFIPIDRHKAQDVVGQTVNWYAEHDKCWIAIAPEGTRSKVDDWKSGFLRIAHAAEVPVLLVGFDYPSKSIALVSELFIPSGEHEADVRKLRDYYATHFTGRHPDKQ